jgi:hypothetical protein
MCSNLEHARLDMISVEEPDRGTWCALYWTRVYRVKYIMTCLSRYKELTRILPC